MKKGSAHFQVSSRLASLLSQEYSSTEKALKELVDNAWDADAESVSITLPAPMSDEPIVVEDDGTGMTAAEIRGHYLAIAADRRVARGERTAGRNRRVKGRKGIGKFAGLMAAAEMNVETRARSRVSAFTVRLSDLAQIQDIEKLPIEVQGADCGASEHGTKITLFGLHQGLAFPDAGKLRQVLLQEYGREAGVSISVNGKRLGVDDVQGTYRDETLAVEGMSNVRLRITVGEKKSVTRQPGIQIRVDGKAVGRPTFFGLDESDDFPPKLLKRLYGELDADDLRDHVTAGWDAVLENSELLAKVREAAQPLIRRAYSLQYGQEMQLAKARLSRKVHDRLAMLPEYRREYADRAIKRVLDRFFGEPVEKIEPYVFVLLEAIERTDYGTLLEHIADSSRKDIAAIAEALDDFGFAEMAYLVEQATARQAYLDNLETLLANQSTLEATMHKALEKNLWVLGHQFSLFSSNKTLRTMVDKTVGSKYEGDKADLRPDLLLNEDLAGEYLLIEFKRPSHSLKREDYTQAVNYRHEFAKTTTKRIHVLVIGGSRSADYPTSHLEPDVGVLVFSEVIATARRMLDWQLKRSTGSVVD
ncbi:MAG: ATP-binding protein [Acidovorax sp.]|nr:ATP-binding protein [Acidovorax sp.]